MNREIRKVASELMAKVIESEDPDLATISIVTDSDHYNLVYKKKEGPKVIIMAGGFVCPYMLQQRPKF